jgi:hypothetical protein
MLPPHGVRQLDLLPQQRRLVLSGANAIIPWPAPSTGYELEEATDLLTPQPTIWTPVGIVPTVVAGMNTVAINGVGVGQKFYRLKK